MPGNTRMFSDIFSQLEKFKTIMAVVHIDKWLVSSEMEDAAMKYLSPLEQHYLSTLYHPRRRKEWLASRVVAKYLFLVQLVKNTSNLDQMEERCPHFQILLPNYFIRFAVCEYQQIEIPTISKIQRGPRLVWKSQDVSNIVSVSISHTEGWATAIVGTAAYIGVDMEKVITLWSDSFLRESFLEAERAWVYLNNKTCSININCLYTFLWTLKEASFKAGLAKEWYPKKIEVTLLCPISTILKFHNICSSKYLMVVFPVQIKTNVSQWFCEASCFRTREWLLTAIIRTLPNFTRVFKGGL